MARTRKVVKDSSLKNAFKKPHLKRLSQRGGVKRVSDAGGTYETTREIINDLLMLVLKDVSVMMQFSGRSTLEEQDIVFALRARGMNIYGTRF